MEIRIGTLTAGTMNNVEGNQHITGGQHGTVVMATDLRQAVDALRAAVSTAGLDQLTAARATAEVDTLESGIRAPHPDRGRLERALGQLKELLTVAGSMATTGKAVAGPWHTLAAWVATLG